jgi:hypothetical protein
MHPFLVFRLRNFFFIWFLLCCLPCLLSAQTTDAGSWTSLGAEKKMGKWNLVLEAELRSMSHFSEINRWSLQASASYTIFKPLTAGIAYQYIRFNDLEYSDFQPRQRYIFYLQGKQKLGNFTLSLRERVQRTIKDESDRVKSSGEYDTYRINPEIVLRSRLRLEYNIHGLPLNPYTGIEAFYQLNNPEGNCFDNLRLMLGCSYSLSKHHKIDVYGALNREIHTTDPEALYVAGLAYTFSF